MYTLRILAGLAYIVYHAFKAVNALARKRALPPADSAVAHVDCHSRSIARPPASESLGWPAGGVIRTQRCRGRFRLAICRQWSSWTRCPSSLTAKMINVNRNCPDHEDPQAGRIPFRALGYREEPGVNPISSESNMLNNPCSRRELMGLGSLARIRPGVNRLLAADTIAKPAGLEQAITQLEQTWNGEFAIVARRLDAQHEFRRRADSMLPTASVCKLFVLCELFRQAEAGLIDLNAPVTWKPEHHRGGDGVLRAMVPGQSLSAHNMAVLMIVLSDNIATAVLVDLLGAANIERSLKTWELGDSHFYAGLPAGPRRTICGSL